MSIEAGILMLLSLVMLLLIIRYLDWRNNYPLFLVFFILVGLVNHTISGVLINKGYLAFPWRIFPAWVPNNLDYDLFLLPAFTLLLIDIAVNTRKFWQFTLFYAAFITVQDYLISQYTTLLVRLEWPLVYTAISSALIFMVWLFVYQRLKRYIRPAFEKG